MAPAWNSTVLLRAAHRAEAVDRSTNLSGLRLDRRFRVPIIGAGMAQCAGVPATPGSESGGCGRIDKAERSEVRSPDATNGILPTAVTVACNEEPLPVARDAEPLLPSGRKIDT